MQKTLRCFARGSDGHFEAICIDLDIAIEARSLEEAKRTLNRSVQEYVKAAIQEEPAVARQLLTRRSPWHVRMSWICRFGIHMIFGRHDQEDRSLQAGYDLPCPA